MRKFFNYLLLSVMTVLPASAEKRVETMPRGKCDYADEIIATVYADDYFSRPENRHKRDRIIKNVLNNSVLCDPKYY
jgi:hypothetical protein